MSKVDILRALITEKMTVAVREILAVMETTVSGYEVEILSLKNELSNRKQLDLFLQPQIRLQKLALDETEGGAKPWSRFSTSKRKKDLRPNNKHGRREKCGRKKWKCSGSDTGAGGADVKATEVSPDETQPGHREGFSVDQTSASCPGDVKRVLEDPVTDAPILRSRRKRRLPGRYRLDLDMPEHREKERVTEQGARKRLNPSLASVRKRRRIQLRMCLLKSGPDAELHEGFSVRNQTLACHQDLSESDFVNHLRSVFPELGENKPFEAFVAAMNRTKDSAPARAKRLTLTELHRAFRSHRQNTFSFSLQLKEQGKTCNTLTKAETESCDNATVSDSEEETASRTDGTGGSAEQSEFVDRADRTQDGGHPGKVEAEDWDDSFSREQNREDHEGEDDLLRPDEARKDPERFRKKRKACKVCGITYCSSPLLTKHALNHLDDPRLMCGVCGQRLESSEELKSHLETHQKLHQCEKCGQYFLTFVVFHKHSISCRLQRSGKPSGRLWKRESLTEKPFKCPVCPQAFRFEVQLLVHSSKHIRHPPFSCNICRKTTNKHRRHSNHKLTHSGRRNLSCTVCDYKCGRKTHLDDHMATHTGTRPYSCSLCNKAFTQSHCLRSHLKRYHPPGVLKQAKS